MQNNFRFILKKKIISKKNWRMTKKIRDSISRGKNQGTECDNGRDWPMKIGSNWKSNFDIPSAQKEMEKKEFSKLKGRLGGLRSYVAITQLIPASSNYSVNRGADSTHYVYILTIHRGGSKDWDMARERNTNCFFLFLCWNMLLTFSGAWRELRFAFNNYIYANIFCHHTYNAHRNLISAIRLESCQHS